MLNGDLQDRRPEAMKTGAWNKSTPPTIPNPAHAGNSLHNTNLIGSPPQRRGYIKDTAPHRSPASTVCRAPIPSVPSVDLMMP
ncbi:hypothetical protein BPY_18850 [Bifidobacterium psychraerophilum]